MASIASYMNGVKKLASYTTLCYLGSERLVASPIGLSIFLYCVNFLILVCTYTARLQPSNFCFVLPLSQLSQLSQLLSCRLSSQRTGDLGSYAYYNY